MNRTNSLSPEVKVSAVEDYLKGLKPVTKICYELSVGISIVEGWIRIYRSKEAIGLFPQNRNKTYSKE